MRGTASGRIEVRAGKPLAFHVDPVFTVRCLPMASPPAEQHPVSHPGSTSLLSRLDDHRTLFMAVVAACIVMMAPEGWAFAGRSIVLVWLPMSMAIVACAHIDRLRRARRNETASHLQLLLAREAAVAALERTARAANDTERELEVMIAEQVQELSRVRRTAEAEAFERRRAEELLRRVAHEDPLTGLPNRALLRDRFVMAASTARRNGTRVGILLIDLDGFRAINDTHGAAIGDQILVNAAGLMRGKLREVDMLARAGGDEFVVLMHDLPSAHEAALVAGRILAVMATPMMLSDTLTLTPTASIGIAVLGIDGNELDDLLKSAASALDRARQSGGNGWRYHTAPVDTVIPSVSSILRARRDAAAPTP